MLSEKVFKSGYDVTSKSKLAGNVLLEHVRMRLMLVMNQHMDLLLKNLIEKMVKEPNVAM